MQKQCTSSLSLITTENQEVAKALLKYSEGQNPAVCYAKEALKSQEVFHDS